jgi:hypothetical protein
MRIDQSEPWPEKGRLSHVERALLSAPERKAGSGEREKNVLLLRARKGK